MRAGRGSGQMLRKARNGMRRQTQVLDERPPFGAVGMDGHVDGVMMIESESIVNEGLTAGTHGQRSREACLERTGRGW